VPKAPGGQADNSSVGVGGGVGGGVGVGVHSDGDGVHHGGDIVVNGSIRRRPHLPRDYIRRLHYDWVVQNSSARVRVMHLVFGECVLSMDTTLLQAAAIVHEAHHQLGHLRDETTFDVMIDAAE
jgi:hypothetical protein